ncbi:MAG: transcription termination factor NusA [bacterium]
MSEVTTAIKQICEEKGLSYDAVIGTIESALAAAYRKDYGEKNQNIKVEFDPEKMTTKIYDIKTVVEDMPEEEEVEEGEEKPVVESTDEDGEVRRFNPKTEIQLSDAKEIKKKYKIDDEIKTKLPAHDDYGRMAAQTAKQVIIQRLREAERDMVYNEFKDKEHEVITGVVQRVEGRVVLVDLGRAMGIILPEDQIRSERYRSGERLKVYVREVRLSPKGPEIILSRTSDEILKKVFYLEIPEISNGLIEIKAVAREAGSRSKVAVQANSDNIDPIGSCVGQRGSRIQTIINELGGEKIDIIEYSDDTAEFISNSLAPAKINEVELDDEEKKATIKVNEDQLSLSIGKNGQNVRLAAHLTGWKIDISESETGKIVDIEKEKEEEKDVEKEKEEEKEVKKKKKEEIKEDNK